MTTVTQLIKRDTQFPIRRAYIKRRYLDGNYESNWQRIDFLNSEDRVLSWGSFSLEVDFQPGQIGAFEISELTIAVDNQGGQFNIETDPQSIWYPDSTYLNRRYTKIKIEAGFLDEDENEVGVETVFEGVIERVVISESQTAQIMSLPYTAILKSFLIADLGLSGPGPVSSVVTSIMNQSKITAYIPYIAPTNTINPTISDMANLEGTYWDVLKSLAQQANAIPYLNGPTWAFKDREAGGLVWQFNGAGTQFPDIFTIEEFDDEGADRVRLYWQAKGTTLTAISSDDTLKRKYLNAPQIIDLDNYDNANKAIILSALLAEWEQPRPRVGFVTNFMVNEIDLLDKVTLKVIGPISPPKVGVWGSGTWGDGTYWGQANGSINISSGVEWMTTRIIKDLDSWVFNILCERVV